MNLYERRAFDYDLHMRLRRAEHKRRRTQNRRIVLLFGVWVICAYVVIASWL
jgi:hypothetical protein